MPRCSLICLALLGAFLQGAQAGAAPVTIQFHNSAEEEVDFLEEAKKVFEAENPGIKVEILHQNNLEQLFTLIAAGSVPDAAWFEDEPLPSWAHKGLLLDLTDRLKSSAMLRENDVFPPSLTAFRYRGRLYALPINGSAVAYYLNMDMLNNLGVSYPSPQWTIDEWLQIGKKATRDNNQDGKPESYGADFQTWWPYLMSWIWRYGGSFFSNDGSRTTINSEASVRGLEALANTRFVDRIAPPDTDGGALFREGRLATFRNGSWFMAWRNQEFVKLPFEMDVQIAPHGPSGSWERNTWEGLVVPAGAKHLDEGWRFIEFLASQRGQRMLLGKVSNVPSNIAVARSGWVERAVAPLRHVGVWVEAFNHTRPAEITRWYDDVVRITDEEFNPVWQGQRPVREAAEAAARRINTLIEDSK